MGKACSLLSGRNAKNIIEDPEKHAGMDFGQPLSQDGPEEQPSAALKQEAEASVGDSFEVNGIDRRPEVSSDITQEIVDALKLSPENGTLQSCPDKGSSGNTMETAAVSTEAPQAEVVCESESYAKIAILSSSHVPASKESAEHEEKKSDESEPSAPRVVAPYLSHMTTTKESEDEEKNESDESESAPRVVDPYLSHVTPAKESEPAPSEDSMDLVNKISDESQPAPSNESAGHERKNSDDSEPIPRVVARHLINHIIASSASAEEPEKAIPVESEPIVTSPKESTEDLVAESLLESTGGRGALEDDRFAPAVGKSDTVPLQPRPSGWNMERPSGWNMERPSDWNME